METCVRWFAAGVPALPTGSGGASRIAKETGWQYAGLDVVPLPGEISTDQLARIIGDVASLAVKWHKPLSARLLPVAGKKAGERTEFADPFLVNATLQPLP